MATMWKAFLAMPTILRFLTAAGFCVCLMVVSTFFPFSPVRILGRPVSELDWWGSGAGYSMVIVAGLFGSSGVMMLRRSHHARLAHLVAWIALNISVPYVAGVTGAGVASVSKTSVLANALVTMAIALYLYLGRGTRNYFRSADAHGQGA